MFNIVIMSITTTYVSERQNRGRIMFSYDSQEGYLDIL